MPRWSRYLISAALLLAASELAFAASLSVATEPSAGGTSTIASCDADGFTFKPTLDGSQRITSVTISGIATPCAGGLLRLTLVNGSTSVGSGTATLPSSGFTGFASVTIAALPASSSVTAVYSAVEGP